MSLSMMPGVEVAGIEGIRPGTPPCTTWKVAYDRECGAPSTHRVRIFCDHTTKTQFICIDCLNGFLGGHGAMKVCECLLDRRNIEII